MRTGRDGLFRGVRKTHVRETHVSAIHFIDNTPPRELKRSSAFLWETDTRLFSRGLATYE
jgi:hypothetical protein